MQASCFLFLRLDWGLTHDMSHHKCNCIFISSFYFLFCRVYVQKWVCPSCHGTLKSFLMKELQGITHHLQWLIVPFNSLYNFPSIYPIPFRCRRLSTITNSLSELKSCVYQQLNSFTRCVWCIRLLDKSDPTKPYANSRLSFCKPIISHEQNTSLQHTQTGSPETSYPFIQKGKKIFIRIMF